MIPGVVAKRYATALFQIGTETSSLEALVDELARLAATYEGSKELRDAIDNPLVPREAKQAVVKDVAQALGLGQTATSTALMLTDRRRLPALAGIVQRLREMTDARLGVVRADVVSARPLDGAHQERLKGELERITGRRVVLDTRVDATLLAGVVARVGDRVFDGSLVTRLRRMRETLLPN